MIVRRAIEMRAKGPHDRTLAYAYRLGSRWDLANESATVLARGVTGATAIRWLRSHPKCVAVEHLLGSVDDGKAGAQ